jgi:DNA-binding CsgD family transcriptional regulator/tetratricopeptide (TPR) repeat protein
MAGVVLGRDAEQQRLSRFLESLKQGPAACVLEGEAGIGKTALWRDGLAMARADALRVLWCAPAQVEAALSYSALADLLDEVEPEILAALPAPQRDALEIALLRTGPGDATASQRAIATATVSVLTSLAASAPLLVAIDDVQWLDRPSARVLEFAVRRLAGHPVGFLLSLRTPAEGAGPLGLDRAIGDEQLDHIRVSGLSAGALHQLIKERLGGTFSRAGLLRLHSATSGNPLFALELAASLLRAGSPGAGEALPVPDDVRELVAARLRRLPVSTREALLFAAASPHPTAGVLRHAVGASSKQMLTRLAGAEEAGVIVVEGETVRFKHPLFASAIYAAASTDQRRDAHRRLAALSSNPEQRARHLALGTELPESAVASTVAEAARDVRRRGAPDAAAELTELAIRLTPTDESDARDRRALELAYYLAEAGDTEPARAVLLAVVDRAGPLQARALLDLAGLAYWGEGSAPAVARCEQALAAASGEPALEAVCHAELAVYCDFDAARSERHAKTALDLLDGEGGGADPDTLIDALLGAARASLVLGRGLPRALVERAYECEAQAETSIHRSRVGGQVGQWLKYIDDFAGSRARLEAALAQAAEEGDEGSTPNVLMHLAQLECWSGNWPLASRYAEESVELAEQVAQNFGGPPAMRALVDAHRGNVERARVTVESRLDVVQPIARPLYLRALGFLELSLGNAADAELLLSRAVEDADSFGIREAGVFRIHADLIEALIGTGSLARAEAVLAAFEQQARTNRLAWSLATSARCRGLLLAAHGELDASERSLEDALHEHERLPMPFERARTLLVLGLLRRRRNERRHAHELLAEALAIFDELGAPLWAARTRRELRPLGGRPTSRVALTPAEQRVADLAGSGLTNRQVAAALFISPKTVESSLARVYRKLDIRSRAELGAHSAVNPRA